jgi:hypothetical protein
MSALGQKPAYAVQKGISALPSATNSRRRMHRPWEKADTAIVSLEIGLVKGTANILTAVECWLASSGAD